MECSFLHLLDCMELNSLDHSRNSSTERISKCLPSARTNSHNTNLKQDNQTELDMELDLQIPKHNYRIQRKRSI